MSSHLLRSIFCFLSVFAGSISILCAATSSSNLLSFSAFEPEHSEQQNVLTDPQWYAITFGYVDLEEAPPGKAFILPELPSAFLENAKQVKLRALLNAKHRKTDYTTVYTDPFGKVLDEPFALGESIYALVKKDEQSEIHFSFYFYDNPNVRWFNENKPGPTRYDITGVQWQHELNLRSDVWFIENISQRQEEYLSNSVAKVRTLYRYAFVKIIRL